MSKSSSLESAKVVLQEPIWIFLTLCSPVPYRKISETITPCEGLQSKHQFWSLLSCRESLQGSLESLYQTSQYQANRVGSNIYQGYGYVQDGIVSGSGRSGLQQLLSLGNIKDLLTSRSRVLHRIFCLMANKSWRLLDDCFRCCFTWNFQAGFSLRKH